MSSPSIVAWRQRRSRKVQHQQAVARLDRLAREQWHEERRAEAVEDIKRDRGRARRDIEAMPFKAGALAVLKAVSGFCFHYRGMCAKAIEDIANKAGVSIRSARRHLRELEENGVIELVHQGRGRGLTSIWRVCRDVIREAAARIKNAAKSVAKKAAKRPCGKPANELLAYIRACLGHRISAFQTAQNGRRCDGAQPDQFVPARQPYTAPAWCSWR